MKVLAYRLSAGENHKLEVLLQRPLRIDTFVDRLAETYKELFGEIPVVDKVGPEYIKAHPEMDFSDNGAVVIGIGSRDLPYFTIEGPSKGAQIRYDLRLGLEVNVSAPHVSMEHMKRCIEHHME